MKKLSEIYEAWAIYHGYSRHSMVFHWYHSTSGFRMYSDREIVKMCIEEMGNL